MDFFILIIVFAMIMPSCNSSFGMRISNSDVDMWIFLITSDLAARDRIVFVGVMIT